MQIKHTAAALAVVAGISGVALFGANAVSAQPSGETLVERLATRFNLDQGEVQAVFDEVHEERHEERKAERQERMSEHLQELVEEGTITAEQKSIIEAARAKMEASAEALKPDNFRSLSDEERDAVQEQLKELRDAFEQTLSDAGIDIDDIKPDHQHGHRGGHGHHKGGHDF